MLGQFFRKTIGRDDILSLLAAALKKRDQTTVHESLSCLIKEHGDDPQIQNPVELTLQSLQGWNDPYLVLLTAAKILENAPENRSLAAIADKAALKAAAMLENTDPCYAINTYADIFERMPPESALQLDCIDGALRVTKKPGLVDFENLARTLGQMVESSDNADPAQTRLQNRLFDLAEQARDSVLALELYLEIYGNSDGGSAIETDSFNAIIKISEACTLEQSGLVLEGLYHAHDVAADNPQQQRTIENHILTHADRLEPHDRFSAFTAYHFLLESVTSSDAREAQLIQKLLDMSEDNLQRDFENTMNTLVLIMERAASVPYSLSRARTLYNHAVQRNTPQDYEGLKPLSPKNFALLQGNQPR